MLLEWISQNARDMGASLNASIGSLPHQLLFSPLLCFLLFLFLDIIHPRVVVDSHGANVEGRRLGS